MSTRNTMANFGSVAKWFHWVTAACFLVCFMVVWFRHYIAEFKSDAWHSSLDYHIMAGWTVLALVLPRLYWRFKNIQPLEPPGSKLEHLGAKIGHWALYAMMIIMPITGYMGTHDDSNIYGLFSIPTLQDTALWQVVFVGMFDLTWDQVEAFADFVHKDILGAWILWILILIHIGAGLYHHYVKRDTTLVRMLPGSSAPDTEA